MNIEMSHTVLERFLRYVQIDTQSDPGSASQPSTEKQKDLGRLLVAELQAMGVTDAHLDEYGYVYATVPATVSKPVPVICYCAHVDTSPDVSGAGVRPIVHHGYNGQPIRLPDDPRVVIDPSEHPDLAEQLGNDIVTASGTTLLGADNKSGVAAIVDAAAFLMAHPEIPHGDIRLLFTPDEEIGRGVNRVDLQKLGAAFGYTVDGERLGSLEDETFSADAAVVRVNGVSVHPGFAKGKMENAIKIVSDIVARLPKAQLSPESTSGREGFLHPTSIQGGLEQAELQLIVRDFTDEGLLAHEALLKKIVEEVLEGYPNSRAEIAVTEQYRNMKKVLDTCPQVVDYAAEAMR
ncbi:MAG: hypothetical protein RL386_1116, partial [Bacteroidota bacterium]